MCHTGNNRHKCQRPRVTHSRQALGPLREVLAKFIYPAPACQDAQSPSARRTIWLVRAPSILRARYVWLERPRAGNPRAAWYNQYGDDTYPVPRASRPRLGARSKREIVKPHHEFAGLGSAVDRPTATPPYAAYSAFESFIQRAANEEVPARVDKALLGAWG